MKSSTERQDVRSALPWIAAAIVFVLAALAASGVVALLEQRRIQDAQAEAQLTTTDKSHQIEHVINQTLSATYALGALVRQGGGKITDFQTVAAAMLKNYPGAASLQLVPGGVLGDVVPLAGNEATIGHNLLANPKRNKEALRARDSGQLTLAGPFELIQGGIGAVGRLPIYLPRASDGAMEFWGFTAVMIRFPDALADQLPQLEERGFDYELSRTDPYTNEKQVIMASSGATLIEPVQHGLYVPDSVWVLSVAPIGGWRNTSTLMTHGALALLISLLFAWQNRWWSCARIAAGCARWWRGARWNSRIAKPICSVPKRSPASAAGCSIKTATHASCHPMRARSSTSARSPASTMKACSSECIQTIAKPSTVPGK